MKTWEEMTETEREELLCPTFEKTLPDGTTKRIPKIENHVDWLPKLSPYRQMKYDKAMAWSHEDAALAYADCSCDKIVDQALLEHTKWLLLQSIELSVTVFNAQEQTSAQRRRGGKKRHQRTNMAKTIAMQKWRALPESAKARRGTKKLFAEWVQNRFEYPKGEHFPKDIKTVYAWISEWDKAAK